MSEDSSLKGVGGALFAGVIMIMAGAFWALEGLAGIVKGTFYVRAGHYFITSSASSWGWIHLILGLLVCLAGSGSSRVRRGPGSSGSGSSRSPRF